MNPIRPLLFLTFRTVVNGLKRALTTPRRLFTLIFFVGYYFFLFIRPALGPAGGMPMRGIGRNVPLLDFPPLQVIDAVSFGIFSVLSLLLLLNVVSANTSFRPADIDVLFSTPISPKVVLGFRMLRDYLITLFVPMLLAIFGLRPARIGWEAVFRNMPNPEYSGMAIRFLIISWILMSLCWVTISYAVSMWLNRNDARSDRRRRVFGSCMVAFIAGLIGYVVYRFTQVQSPADALAIAQTPGLRVVFFTATFATQMTLAPFSSAGPAGAMVGLGGMFGVIAVSTWLALRQVGWMYDQAAVKTAWTRTAANLQRTGDLSGLMALRAREGKYEGLKLKFVSRLKMTGWKALMWKELILQPRTTLGLLVIFTVMGVFMSVISVLPGKESEAAAGLHLVMPAMVVFMISMALGQSAFIEVLRRVDLQKPLPFKPWVTVAAEIGSKAVITVAATSVGIIVAFCVKPSIWPHTLAALIGAPGFAYLLSACVFLVTMLFPDVDDSSQRGIRGMLTMLSVLVCSLFPALIVIGLIVLHLPPFLATGAGSLLALGIGLLLTLMSARLYESFNPSE